jgi:hypothetical protein
LPRTADINAAVDVDVGGNMGRQNEGWQWRLAEIELVEQVADGGGCAVKKFDRCD